jgi:hypothetical protein
MRMHPIAWLATVIVPLAGYGVSTLVRFAMDRSDDDLALLVDQGGLPHAGTGRPGA